MMRKFIITIISGLLLFACQDEGRQDLLKPEETQKEADSIRILTGEFIFVADAAVFRGEDFVYGVHIDSMAQVLAEQIQPYKKEDFDMVPVKIKGKIVPNPRQEGWEENIEIQEIIGILEAKKASENE